MGHVECCGKTGYLNITDSTASIPLVPMLSTQQQNLAHSPPILEPLNAVIGSTVVLSGLTVYVEKMTQQNDLNTASHLTYINASLCKSIVTATVRERDSFRTSSSRCLYFHVTNKNCVVVRPQSSMMFTVHTIMSESLETLREKSEEDKKDGSGHERPGEVALNFSEGDFKWYSYVVNGGIYSIKTRKELPSLKELDDVGFLQVTSDMKLECVGYSPPQQVKYDTTDLIDTVNLPGFMRSNDNHQQKRYGVIKKFQTFITVCKCMCIILYVCKLFFFLSFCHI